MFQEVPSGISGNIHSSFKDFKEVRPGEKLDGKEISSEKTQVSCVDSKIDPLKLHSSPDGWKSTFTEVNVDDPGISDPKV